MEIFIGFDWANNGAAANVRPAFPLRVFGAFGGGLCAPPFRSAHVAELGR
jgi:hypothetical protein